MTKKCELTGVLPLKGHNVSHSNNKTKRRFLPNLKKVSFKSDILKKKIKSLEESYGLDLMLYFSRLVKNNKRGSSKEIRFH